MHEVGPFLISLTFSSIEIKIHFYLFSFSGFFNGTKFFDGGNTGRHAGGAMYMIMGVLWLLALPVSILMLFLVSWRGHTHTHSPS